MESEIQQADQADTPQRPHLTLTKLETGDVKIEGCVDDPVTAFGLLGMGKKILEAYYARKAAAAQARRPGLFLPNGGQGRLPRQ